MSKRERKDLEREIERKSVCERERKKVKRERERERRKRERADLQEGFQRVLKRERGDSNVC